MHLTIDLTREKFDSRGGVDFYDGKTIFFDVTTVLPEKVEFLVWGASLDKEFEWEKYVSLKDDARLNAIVKRSSGSCVQIQGFGKIAFENVVAGRIEIYPCDMSTKGDYGYFQDKKGRTLTFTREWNAEQIDASCYEYCFDIKIAFPFGACDLKLYTRGKVSFTFNTADCVTYQEYILNPHKTDTFYGFTRYKAIASNTYKDFKI